jgi:O-antigen/teichoic acid export membrane protein
LAGILSSAGAGILSLVAGIVLLPIVISSVGSASYGIWLLISAIATYLNYSDLGVGTAIVHFGSRARVGGESRTLGELLSAGLLWNTAALFLIMPIYFLVGVSYISSNARSGGLTGTEPQALVTLGAIMTATLVLKPFSSALTGAGRLPIDKRNQGVGVIVRIVGTLIACLLFGNVVAVAVAETTAVLVPSLLSAGAVYIGGLAPLAWGRSSFTTLKYMLSYSVRSFAVNLIGALILQAGTVIVGVVTNPSDVTYFNAAFRIYTSVRLLMSWLSDPFRPALSRLYVSSHEAATRVLESLAFISLSASLVGCGTLILGSVDIVDIWLGSKVPTSEVALTFVILLTGLTVNAIHIPLIPAGDAAGYPGVFFSVQLLWVILFVPLGFWWGHLLGIAGVALALTLPLLVVEPIYLWRASVVLGFRIGDWLRAVIAPALKIVGGGLALLSVYEAATIILKGPELSLWASGAFLLGCALSSVVLRRWLPWNKFREALRTEL